MLTFDLIQPGGAASDPHDAMTLGIEVTDAGAARCCALGVVDPQHAPGGGPDAPAAIEACLDRPLPPAGARLVTIRPDLDAVGAMALLALRAEGRAIDAALRARVRRIAAVDRFDRGHWPGPRALPSRPEDLLSEGIGAEMASLAAAVGDRSVALAGRVETVRHWLTEGVVPPAYAEAAHDRAERLLRSLRAGATRVEAWWGGRIGVVISIEPGALSLAYRLAPVAVALNPAHRFADGGDGRKYTLARWAEGDADLDAAVAPLCAGEAGWGGQRGIKGSPQDRPSRLTLEAVVEAVAEGLPATGEEAA